MKHRLLIFFVAFVALACNNSKTTEAPSIKVDLTSKQANIELLDQLVMGKTYLPVYSHIYHIHEHLTFDLTTTVSIRNVSPTQKVYILKADYFNTAGELVREYLKKPIFLNPLETVEIVIGEEDMVGGSGANFVFDWATKNGKNPPLFEAVMISTHGQQGISFTTRGVIIEE